MHIEDVTALKKWIIPKLELISDADSDVLADYVIALIKTEDTDETVKENCLTSLPDFLHDHTQTFVDELFNAIQTKSFLPGYAPPVSSTLSAAAPAFNPPTGPFNPPTGPAAGTNRQVNLPGLSNGTYNGKGDLSRKRTYNERDTSESRDGRDSHYNRNASGDRSIKQIRRGGRNGRGGLPGQDIHIGGLPGFGGMSMSMPMPAMPTMPTMSAMPTPPPGFPPFDNTLAGLLAMSAMGFGLPGMPPLPTAGSPPAFGQTGPPSRELPPGRKERCKDYDTKGFCALGSVCPYEHGADHIIVPPSAEGIYISTFSNSVLPQGYVANDPVPEYDPNKASLAVEPQKGTNEQGSFEGNRAGDRSGGDRSGDRGRGRGRGRGDRGGSTGNRGRAPFSHAGPIFDRSNTSVVVEQIPEEKFDEQSVRDFFSEFGNVVEVQMQAYKRLAIVKFDDHFSAKRAYDSPKVIFDNRFVKVYWYKADSVPTPPAHLNGGAKSGSPPTSKPDEEMLDPEEVANLQAEKQRAYEEKMKRLKETEAQREELNKKLKATADEHKKMLERIAAKQSRKTASAEGEAPAATEIDGADSTGENKTKAALEAQFAALEAEAKMMGIDHEVKEDDMWQGFPRGRGRGGYRGRAGYFPRGRGFDHFRGSYRGRGSFTGAPYGGARGGVKRLDNRPKRVAIGGVEAGTAKDEALRQYLFNNFEFDSIEPHPDRKDAQVVTFGERYIAESFIATATNIPNVGKVELSWVQNAPGVTASTTASATIKRDQPSVDNDVKMDEHANGSTDNGGRGGDVDYDVADDEDRWMAT
ncbi:hypothetical protein K432DRAFT_472427 [Lepidopterella palustris CBS 459.81]|uniref:CCCH zinc finger and RRM domain-containing protein n=1 Tax=Lepidopterella palustris CBS 459.81 TaxID=1314670 RepID=A0A8E2EE95_9PEZI|nr:hypothetical protein K432DRAFT_472427 [Lepidopterella palustris CBS 459.81]